MTRSGLLLHCDLTIVSVGLLQSQAEDLLQRNAGRGDLCVFFEENSEDVAGIHVNLEVTFFLAAD